MLRNLSNQSEAGSRKSEVRSPMSGIFRISRLHGTFNFGLRTSGFGLIRHRIFKIVVLWESLAQHCVIIKMFRNNMFCKESQKEEQS
jgi:hypothetical protein